MAGRIEEDKVILLSRLEIPRFSAGRMSFDKKEDYR